MRGISLHNYIFHFSYQSSRERNKIYLYHCRGVVEWWGLSVIKHWPKSFSFNFSIYSIQLYLLPPMWKSKIDKIQKNMKRRCFRSVFFLFHVCIKWFLEFALNRLLLGAFIQAGWVFPHRNFAVHMVIKTEEQSTRGTHSNNENK